VHDAHSIGMNTKGRLMIVLNKFRMLVHGDILDVISIISLVALIQQILDHVIQAKVQVSQVLIPCTPQAKIHCTYGLAVQKCTLRHVG